MEDAIKGLKCDNPDCTFTDMSVNSSNVKEWINRKCPLCGQVLLTKAEYETTKTVIGFMKQFDKS